jgi:hypothetical protein
MMDAVHQYEGYVAQALAVDEDHHILSKICSWFTEGFDTKELQEAKVLLAELSCT